MIYFNSPFSRLSSYLRRTPSNVSTVFGMDSSTETIRKSAVACQLRFKECISDSSLNMEDRLVSSQADFNLWLFGTKGTSTGRSSLDYRLRERPNINLMICNLLGGLEESLEQCLAIRKSYYTSIQGHTILTSVTLAQHAALPLPMSRPVPIQC